MRRTKARRVRRARLTANSAFETISSNGRVVRPIAETDTHINHSTLPDRSEEIAIAETRDWLREQGSKHGCQSNSFSHSTFPSKRQANFRVKQPLRHIAGTSKASTEVRKSSNGCLSQRSSDNSFHNSQQNTWQRLPTGHRLFSLLLGFLSMYYFMFGKHHHYDKEILAIHSDVEDLLRRANDTVLGENLVEAELPEVFREKDRQSATAMPSEVAKANKVATTTYSTDQNGIRDSSSPLKVKRTRNKASENNSTAEPRNDFATNEIDVKLPHTKANSSKPSMRHKRKTERHGSEVKEGPSNTNSSEPVSVVIVESQASVPRSTAATPTRSSEKLQNVSIVDSNVSKSQMPKSQLAALQPHNGTSADQIAKRKEEHDYSLEFKDLGPADMPKGHVPILAWDYKAVLDPETAEQIFAFGDKLNHVGAYKPLCIEGATGDAISFSGNRICSGFNRTAGWMLHYCDVLKESLVRENLLSIRAGSTAKNWLEENKSFIHWVDGLTVLQLMEKNCGNIAHFAGRILMLHHIFDNIAAYASPPSAIENILILPTWDIMKRFLYPHNYDFWHKSVLSALVAPATFTIGTLGNFLYRERKIPYDGMPRVQLLHNFSLHGAPADETKYVCFRRVIVPGYLKGRFFADDREYPSKKPSLQSTASEAPRVPRDSLRFREKVSTLFHRTPNVSKMRKEIIFLDRNGSRRVLDGEAKLRVVQVFQRVSSEHGFSFKMVSFDRMPFKEQYETMKGASIAIGIHGANLVNTMFMPPLSVLFELFPFGFVHDMYANGGNSGLKYYKHQMQTGLPFEGPRQYRSVEQCIKLNQKCKVHFRDSALQVTSDDLKAMERTLQDAIRWCEGLPKPSSSPDDG